MHWDEGQLTYGREPRRCKGFQVRCKRQQMAQGPGAGGLRPPALVDCYPRQRSAIAEHQWHSGGHASQAACHFGLPTSGWRPDLVLQMPRERDQPAPVELPVFLRQPQHIRPPLPCCPSRCACTACRDKAPRWWLNPCGAPVPAPAPSGVNPWCVPPAGRRLPVGD